MVKINLKYCGGEVIQKPSEILNSYSVNKWEQSLGVGGVKGTL